MKKLQAGYTLIETLTVITIIGILASIVFISYEGIQASARDSERASKVTVIAESLEKYFEKHGEYPSCNQMIQNPNTIKSDLLTGIDTDVLATPSDGSGANSILASCAELTSDNDKFAYEGDANCIANLDMQCQSYMLSYNSEAKNTAVSLESRYRPANALSGPSAPTVTVALNGSNVEANISPVTCTVGSPQYSLSSSVNNETWSDFTNWGTTMTASQAANDGVKYSYKAQARCYESLSKVSGSSVGPEGTYIDPIAAVPTTPAVTQSTVNSATTYSWLATASCPSGTSIYYRYRYVVDYSGGYTSSWYETSASTSMFNTALQGYQYINEVQAQCHNDNIGGNWSGTGQVGYIRTVENPNPTISYSLERIDADSIRIITSSSCTGGAYLYNLTDLYVVPSYSGINYVWSDSGVGGWWADSHSGIWRRSTWTYSTSTFSWTINNTDGPYLEGMPWYIKVNLRCQNSTTGRYSTETGPQTSPQMLTPA